MTLLSAYLVPDFKLRFVEARPRTNKNRQKHRQDACATRTRLEYNRASGGTGFQPVQESAFTEENWLTCKEKP